MSDPVLEVMNVTKQIGRRRILDRITLSVGPGEVVGFIGPNGAGKTTLLRIITGLSRATSGTVRIAGQFVDGSMNKQLDIGVVPEVPGFVEHLSGFGNLQLLASIKHRIGVNEIRAAITTCGLNPDDQRAVSKYSLGMRQRLSITQAIMERPRALLLDEPTNGLDAVGIADLRTIIREQAQGGAAILLASHLLSEVERACDRVLIVKDGKVRQELVPTDLYRATKQVRVGVASEDDWRKLTAAFSVKPYGPTPLLGVVTTELSVPELNRRLVALDINVEELGSQHRSLEEAFLDQVEATS